MKAIRIHAFGGPEVLTYEDVPKPKPGLGEVLIKVKAAGVNPVDYKIRSGEFTRAEVKLPTILGREVSGIVEAIGDGVSGYKAGDEVYAFLTSHPGGYADFAIANKSEVAAKPSSLDHEEAAAVPLAAITAWQALFDHGKLKAGQRVLIHGAAGGVGHFAVQFAKTKGAIVIVTVGPDDIDFVQALGADQVINYKEQAFEKQLGEIDLVIDLVGGETQERSWDVLKNGGTMVSTLEQPSEEKAATLHARTKVFMAEPKHAQLVEIARLIDEGKVRVVIQKTYELKEAALAQEELQHDHSVGKRVLTVS